VRLYKDTYSETCKYLSPKESSLIQRKLKQTTFIEHQQHQQFRGHGSGRHDQNHQHDRYKKHEYAHKRPLKQEASSSWRQQNQDESTASQVHQDEKEVKSVQTVKETATLRVQPDKENVRNNHAASKPGFNVGAKEFRPTPRVEDDEDEFVISTTTASLNSKQDQKKEQRQKVEVKHKKGAYQNPRKYGRL